VATVVEDAPVLEAEVSAGGEAADIAADAYAPLVDQMTTDLEMAATDLAPETAANDPASAYTSPSVGQEIQASAQEAGDPVLAEAQIDAAMAELAAAGNLDVSPSTTTDEGDLIIFQDATEGSYEDTGASGSAEGTAAWYKSPFVIGAAVLAAAFALGG
jgi:hypothetical protein